METIGIIGSSENADPQEQGEIVASGDSLSGEMGHHAAVTACGEHVQIATYRSWASLGKLLPEWDDILRENGTLSIFSTHEWLRSWWEVFGINRNFITLVFSDETGRVLGLAPMYLETISHPLFGRFRELRLLGDGTGDSDNLDLIVRPGSEVACVSALMSWIAQQRNCGVCHFNTFSEDSRCAEVLSSCARVAGWLTTQTSTSNSAITLPDTWEEYLTILPSQFRRLILRCRRKLAGRFDVTFERCEKAEQLEGMLQTLFDLHQKRWKSVNEPGTFASTERRDFYRRMGQRFLDKGWLELWALNLSGKVVASQFSFRYRDTVYGLQEGFDRDYQDAHVGYVLRAAMLESFIQRGVKRYDFLGGACFYKDRWRAKRGTYTNISFAVPWSRAGCWFAVQKSAGNSKVWLRQHLPAQAWRVLHKANLLLRRHDTKAVNSFAANAKVRAAEGIISSD